MKTIIPLYQPPNSREWAKLEALLSDTPSAAAQTTVIMNPAGGPGPATRWPERAHWRALMARFSKLGCRLALYLAAQDAELEGRRWSLTRRKAGAICADIETWWGLFLAHLNGAAENCAWWIDHHPCTEAGLFWPEIVALHKALAGQHTIANVRTVPSGDFARRCPATALCVHSGNGWPPLSQQTIGGKPAAILACGLPGLMPGAKHQATWLYVTPDEDSGGVWNRVSPHLGRILALRAG